MMFANRGIHKKSLKKACRAGSSMQDEREQQQDDNYYGGKVCEN